MFEPLWRMWRVQICPATRQEMAEKKMYAYLMYTYTVCTHRLDAYYSCMHQEHNTVCMLFFFLVTYCTITVCKQCINAEWTVCIYSGCIQLYGYIIRILCFYTIHVYYIESSILIVHMHHIKAVYLYCVQITHPHSCVHILQYQYTLYDTYILWEWLTMQYR